VTDFKEPCGMRNARRRDGPGSPPVTGEPSALKGAHWVRREAARKRPAPTRGTGPRRAAHPVTVYRISSSGRGRPDRFKLDQRRWLVSAGRRPHRGGPQPKLQPCVRARRAVVTRLCAWCEKPISIRARRDAVSRLRAGHFRPGCGAGPAPPHRTDCCRPIRRRGGVKGRFACTLARHL
jgi:hypothetical protein